VDATFVFDFTDIMTTASRWYLVLQDSTVSNAATCSRFVLTDVEHGNIATVATAPMVPQTADASTTYVYVDYAYVDPAPAITQPPVNQTTSPGATATFIITATGQDPLTYQWQRSDDGGASWTDIAGATSTAYTTDPATCADNGAKFRCVVTNAYGTITSSVATLTILCAPVITQQPANQSVVAGQTARFTVVAAGEAPLGYQWQRSTNRGKTYTVIAGATAASYTTPPVTTTDSGNRYRCVVSNAYGTVTSNYATLTVRRK
jgi:hypothetical protein